MKHRHRIPPAPTAEEAREILSIGAMDTAQARQHMAGLPEAHRARLFAITATRKPGAFREFHASCCRVASHYMLPLLTGK